MPRPSDPRRLRVPATLALVATLLACHGCTSPLTTVALREFLREAAGSIVPTAEDEKEAILAAKEATPSPEVEDDTPAATLAETEGDDDASPAEEPLEDAIERSLSRLASAPGFDAVGRDLLVATLEKSEPEDWPAIIESFTESLEDPAGRGSRETAEPGAEPPAGPPAMESAKAKRGFAGGLTVPVAATIPASEPSLILPAVHQAPDDPAPDDRAPEGREGEAPAAGIEPSETCPEDLVASLRGRLADVMRGAPLAVRRACFASKVRGWGSVETFPEPRFAPGQDVLVYMELDAVVAEQDRGGWTTRIDAEFRLLDADGSVVERWSFPTVQDTADAPRTDYFVRYLLRMPAEADAGPHRLEAVLTDAVAGKKASTLLPLDIVPR